MITNLIKRQCDLGYYPQYIVMIVGTRMFYPELATFVINVSLLFRHTMNSTNLTHTMNS